MRIDLTQARCIDSPPYRREQTAFTSTAQLPTEIGAYTVRHGIANTEIPHYCLPEHDSTVAMA